ncbi:MAG TPA: hypothetical protein VK807_24380 [Gemmatimonadaceae bacterium]|jgi:hypothetical protein|nr:hypothetical protein [Gemmatimonadaceae bacterium]
MPRKTRSDLEAENEELRSALEDAQETISDALYSDEGEDDGGDDDTPDDD